MSTPLRHLPLLLPLVYLAGQTACTEPKDGDLVIQQAQPVTVSGESCIATTNEDEYISSGTIDMAVADSYELFPLIRNNISDITQVKGYSLRDARLNTKNISLLRAKVNYNTQEAFAVELSDRTVPLSASVSTNGAATVSVELLTPAMIRQFRNAEQFIVRGSQGEVRPARTSIDLSIGVTVEGETQDGNEVESNEFIFSLRVCNGCTIFYPPEASGPEGPNPNCTNPIEDSLEVGTFCGIGWGGPVRCDVCNAFAPDPLARQLCQPAL